MSDPARSRIGARQRISAVLFAILICIAAVFAVGLLLISYRLLEIRGELDRLRTEALPLLVKLAQLSQDASATSSIAPALSMKPTRSEFDTLMARIRDKESSQRILIEELAALFDERGRVDQLRQSADLLVANLTKLTATVNDQIAVERRLEAHAEAASQLLGALHAENAIDAVTLSIAAQAASQLQNMLLDTNRARFARNRREVDASVEEVRQRLEKSTEGTSGGASEPGTVAHAIAELWITSREEILADKTAELSNAFQIKALAEENSLIANRLLSSASNEFWRANSELEFQIRLVNEATRFTLFTTLGVVVALGVGFVVIWYVLRTRVFERLDQIRGALQRYSESRLHDLADLRPDEIGEISGAMARYMAMIDQREAELAEKTTALERLSSQLAKYLSPQVYDSIFTGKQEVKLASSRKKLTIFFSDIVGFTETADRLESEELTQLLNHYLTEMSRIALRHGATIDKYVGDAIVIFFGDPETRGIREDALACVRMAVDMRRRMVELQQSWRESGIEKPLQVRMGIHTGYCTVGNFGSDDRLDYTIIGGAVNIAARLETQAAPGEILISFETFAHVNGEIACEGRGEVEVKGIAYPVATYCVLDVHENAPAYGTVIQERAPNFSLDMRLADMSATDRKAAATSLARVLRLLNQAPSE